MIRASSVPKFRIWSTDKIFRLLGSGLTFDTYFNRAVSRKSNGAFPERHQEMGMHPFLYLLQQKMHEINVKTDFLQVMREGGVRRLATDSSAFTVPPGDLCCVKALSFVIH